MFKGIYGIPPHYLSDRIDMHFDIHSYDTRKCVQWTFIFQLFTKRYTEIVFYIRVANFSMMRQILLRTLRILKLLNEITESIKA